VLKETADWQSVDEFRRPADVQQLEARTFNPAAPRKDVLGRVMA
jgi:hypothetical protein